MSTFSYTTPMTNPYSQQDLSGESQLRNLIKCRGASTLAAVQSVQEFVMQNKIEWTFELARDLAKYTMNIFKACCDECYPSHISDGWIATLLLLKKSIEQWSDNELYAILVQDYQDGKTLLDFLITLSKIQNQATVHFIALEVIATCSKALTRLQQVTSLDSLSNTNESAWWFSEVDAKHLANLSFQTLIRSPSNVDQSSFPNADQVKLATTCILSHLLKHDRNNSILLHFSEDQLEALCLQLVRESQTLDGLDLPHTTSTTTLSIAVVSTSLLSLIQWKCNLNLSEFSRIIQTTALVENIVHFVFPSGNTVDFSHSGPRWIWDGQYEGSQSYALDLIHSWSLCNSDPWSVFTKNDSLWRPFIETSWTSIFLDQSPDLERVLPKLFLVHTARPLAAKSILVLVMKQLAIEDNGLSKPYQFLISWLLKKSRHPSFIVGVLCPRLLWVFLSDRKSIGAHDDISRSFWGSLDTEMIEECLKLTLEHASTEDSQQPQLLAFLDLLDVLFQRVDNCDLSLSRLGAHSLEKLIYLVKPVEVKFDFMNILDDIQEDTDGNTPPANNLSRLEETSICMEQEDMKSPRGIDHNTRIAAATALSRLGYHASLPSDESIGLLNSRICTAVNDFLTSFHESEDILVTLDIGRRIFRLQNLVATPVNEDFVAMLLLTKQMQQDQKLQQLKKETELKQQQLLEASKREVQLQEEKKRLIKQCRSQSVVMQRELAKVKNSSTQDARQLIAIHVSERSDAEKRATQWESQIQQKDSDLQDAKKEVEGLRKVEDRMKQDLQTANSKMTELDSKNADISRLLREEGTKFNELEERLSVKSEEIVSVRGRQSELEGEINYIKDDNRRLLDNLEDLFADMVSISQIYQYKENEEQCINQKKNRDIEELYGKLSFEREKNKEMVDSVEYMKRENEKLFRKLEKYKQRLVEERQNWQDETQRRKRSGPVSYINQLHDSSQNRSKSRNHLESQKPRNQDSQYDKNSRSKSRSGKENSYYAYESQRQKYF